MTILTGQPECDAHERAAHRLALAKPPGLAPGIF